MPNARPAKRKPLKTHAPGHARHFGTRPAVVQLDGPVVALSKSMTTAERRDYLAATDNDHSQANYEDENFRQTGKRDTGLPYDVKSK
jgi:hypothetical protein